jgi:tetratricopeptide (TPR) repeat protein
MKSYRPRCFCIVILVALISPCWPTMAASAQETGSPVSRQDQFDVLRRQAFEAFYSLDYAASEKLFRQVIELMPDHPAGYLYMATQVWIGQLNRARRLQTGIYSGSSFYSETKEKVDPEVDRQVRDYVKKAIEKAQARLDKNDRDVEARYFLGAAYAVSAGYQGSVTREFFPSLRDGSRAVGEHRKVLEQDPNFADACVSIGMYDYIVGSLPLWVKMIAALGGVRGSKDRGLQELLRAAEHGKYADDDARVLLIAIYSREGQDQKALDLVNQLACRYPRNHFFPIEAANILVKTGRKQEGFEAFESMLQDKGFEDVRDMVHFQYAQTLSANGYNTAALHYYCRVTTLPGASPQLIALAHLRIGQLLDLRGDREAAVAAYKIVLSLDNVFDSHERAQRYLNKPYNERES